MPIPLWVLLLFAIWTLIVLLTTVGIYRWSHILTGRAELIDYPAENPQGKPIYLRAMRAHANCLENLPVYAAIALVAFAANVDAITLDRLAILFIAARVAQSVVHVAFPISNKVVAIRFGFFFIQIIAMLWMGAFVALSVA